MLRLWLRHHYDDDGKTYERHGRDSELVLNVPTGIHREEILKNWPLTGTVRTQEPQLKVLHSSLENTFFFLFS
jgi:hypothetical protein